MQSVKTSAMFTNWSSLSVHSMYYVCVCVYVYVYMCLLSYVHSFMCLQCCNLTQQPHTNNYSYTSLHADSCQYNKPITLLELY